MALTFTPGGAADDTLSPLATVKAYWAGRGMVAPTGTTDTRIEQVIRIATTVVEGCGGPTPNLPSQWPGAKTSAAQRRAWPRTGAEYVDGTAIPSDEVPPAVQDAVAEAAFYELENPGELQEALTGQKITQETVGKLTIRYSDDDPAGMGGMNARIKLTSIYDLLNGLLIPDLSMGGANLFLASVGKNS